MYNYVYMSFSATLAQCCAAYGQGTGTILLDNLACTGTETGLVNCSHNGLGQHNCAHSEDAGLVCARMFVFLRKLDSYSFVKYSVIYSFITRDFSL